MEFRNGIDFILILQSAVLLNRFVISINVPRMLCIFLGVLLILSYNGESFVYGKLEQCSMPWHFLLRNTQNGRQYSLKQVFGWLRLKKYIRGKNEDGIIRRIIFFFF